MKLPPLPAITDEPKSLWTRLLGITPVVMTVIATLLAGLSSSEMNQAQYHRMLAAQTQSKAGDQWNFFQAKKLRAAAMTNTLGLLRATVDIGPIEPAQITAEGDKLLKQPTTAPSDERDILALKLGMALQKLRAAPADAWALVVSGRASPSSKRSNDQVGSANVQVHTTVTAVTVDQVAASINDKDLEEEINSANADAQALDAGMASANEIADGIETIASASSMLAGHDKNISAEVRQVMNDFTAARLRFLTSRYDAEADANQDIAFLYEVQVRVENAHAARHDHRSHWFFLGMLAAQAAVVTSSMALAVRQRSLLWTLAAAVGLMAASFGAYVYLFV